MLDGGRRDDLPAHPAVVLVQGRAEGGGVGGVAGHLRGHLAEGGHILVAQILVGFHDPDEVGAVDHPFQGVLAIPQPVHGVTHFAEEVHAAADGLEGGAGAFLIQVILEGVGQLSVEGGRAFLQAFGFGEQLHNGGLIGPCLIVRLDFFHHAPDAVGQGETLGFDAAV